MNFQIIHCLNPIYFHQTILQQSSKGLSDEVVQEHGPKILEGSLPLSYDDPENDEVLITAFGGAGMGTEHFFKKIAPQKKLTAKCLDEKKKRQENNYKETT